MIKIKRGMEIPIQGAPQQAIEDAPAARAVALVGFDYVGMKPTMAVQEGDRVKRGQLLFSDKNPKVFATLRPPLASYPPSIAARVEFCSQLLLI